MKIPPLAPLCMALALAAAPPAQAGHDHDRARDALARGEIVPLHTLLPEIEDGFAARLLEVDLKRKHGRFIYDMELITDDGQIIELKVDGASGEVLHHEIEDD